MKKIILFILACAPAALFAQEKFEIKGEVAKINAPAKIFLIYRDGAKTITDSTAVAAGKFEFKGEVADITRGYLIVDYKGTGYPSIDHKTADMLWLYLVNGTTKVKSADSLSKATMMGNKVNEDFQRYTAFMKPATDAENALNAEYYAAPQEKRDSKEFSDYYDKKDSLITLQSQALDKQFIAANPDSYMSLRAVQDLSGPYPDVTIIEPAFNGLSEKLRTGKAGVKYQQYINTLKSVMVGAMAPDFAAADTNGTMISLSSFKGKYLLLDFWASWCGPCRHENPNVVKAYNNFKTKNFTILSVSLDRPGKKDLWLKAIHNDNLTWNHVSDLQFWDSAPAKLYGVQAIPQNLLIDPSGKIIAKNLFGDDLEKKLAEIFGGPVMGSLGK